MIMIRGNDMSAFDHLSDNELQRRLTMTKLELERLTHKKFVSFTGSNHAVLLDRLSIMEDELKRRGMYERVAR